MPTGATHSVNGTSQSNGTAFGGSAVESPVTAVKTVIVSPLPLDPSTDEAVNAFPSVPAANAVAPVATTTSSCTTSLTSTITTTSVQFVTVTAIASSLTDDSAKNAALPSSTAATTPIDNGLEDLSGSDSISLATGTPTPAAFFGRPSYGGGGYFSGYGAGSSAVPAVPAVPTTLATIAGPAPASTAAASASAMPASSSGTSTPNTGGSTSGKKGLSYNDASLTEAFAGKGMSWAYNWAASPDGSIVSGAEYVPLLWGLSSVDSWASAAASAISSGSKHALGFNEPDLSTQSNIDPQTAATNHIKYMNPLAGQVEIGSPAITNGAGTSPLMGIDWLNAFFKACAGQCKVDFVAFHWYSDASQIDYFESHVQDVISAASQNGVGKVWLTEFGATGSDSEVASFLGQALPFLDSTAAVERYAYFMCSDGVLVNGNSISSPIGEAYA